MKYLFICYPGVEPAKRQKWLDDNNIVYEYRHIVEQNPTSEELKNGFCKAVLPIKKFFNTSGKIYREMKLKDKIPQMTDEGL